MLYLDYLFASNKITANIYYQIFGVLKYSFNKYYIYYKRCLIYVIDSAQSTCFSN